MTTQTQTPTHISPPTPVAPGMPPPPALAEDAAPAPIPAAPVATMYSDDLLIPYALDIRSILALLPDDDALDDWFLRFTAANEHTGYRFEIDGKGRLLAMASEGRDGAERQFNLQFDLQVWINTGPGGKVMPGNELVRVGRRGRRSADAGWIAPEQLDLLPPPGQRRYGLPFAPRFVAEIRSISESVEHQQAKMQEWLDYGVALGWLIDPFLRQVHIYRPGVAPELLDDPETISGDPELPGFIFAVRRRIFDLP